MTTTGVGRPERARIPQRTLRTDRWWALPLSYLVTLGVVGLYLIYAVFINRHYYWEPYISPMYSPCLTGNCTPGAGWGWFPAIPLTPAIIVIIFPAGLRVTCYYYRKSYYRSYFFSPPACAVAEPAKRYSGESKFPLILQNVHRYFFYITLIFNGILTYDAVIAFRDHSGHWGHAGLGTLILVINAILLWMYNGTCHACRHAFGGRVNNFGKHPIRYKMWSAITRGNHYHGQIAWVSLIFVALTDLYIRLVASGTITDIRFF